MITSQLTQSNTQPTITWEKLPDDYILPDDPVDNIFQPLLAAALRESLELAGFLQESILIATNFGICATVEGKIVVKAPDWVYVSSVKAIPQGNIRRSYTPHEEGKVPSLVLEFISETEGGEYSINPHYPYGKWYFYEQILKVPVYGIFHPKTGDLDLYRLESGKYVKQPSTENNRYPIEELGLFLGVWQGKKAENTSYWLRWWDESNNLLLWGTELLEQERSRTEQERSRAEQAEVTLERLAEKLRELGINPEL